MAIFVFALGDILFKPSGHPESSRLTIEIVMLNTLTIPPNQCDLFGRFFILCAAC